jgi:nicotinamidase-related amidase
MVEDLTNRLIDVNDSMLVLIDVQEHFLLKLPDPDRGPLLKKIIWLVKVARALQIPIIAMGEDLEKTGSLDPGVLASLPPGTVIHNKMVFGLASQPEIMAEIRDTNRTTAILTGLETDVCVAHSAIGLLNQGFQVAVLEDATRSPGKAHQYGIDRIKSAGILISDTKSVLYEWIRSVEALRRFMEAHGDHLGDPGIGL